MILAALWLYFTNPAPNTDTAAFELYRHVQSPTWVAHAASFRSWYDAGHRDWPDSLVAVWSVARVEAEWFKLAEFAASGATAGQRCSVSVADAPGGYAVVVRDSAGNRSAYSNEVSR